MATIQSRPFSKNYSGLINQSVIAGCIIAICVTSHELMKRKRRGQSNDEGLGSVESWEFGYLYQGRSWAKKPSPPHPRGWPLSWVKQVLAFPEERTNELRGIDATLYIRFLRGCVWFTLVHTLTTLPILLPIHVTFSDGSVSPKSMMRASISSLVLTAKGLSLLWIHLLLLIWITLTWMSLLVWLCRGTFRLRAQCILAEEDRMAVDAAEASAHKHPHPHPQYPFHALPPLESESKKSNRGIRLRTVMVANVPPLLRSEKDLKEYFEYYLSRPVAKPALGITTTMTPGFLNKSFAFLFNRFTRIPARFRHPRISSHSIEIEMTPELGTPSVQPHDGEIPDIERVVFVRKMTELASLLERREEVLRLLETAHIKLARRTLAAVKQAILCEVKTTSGDATVPGLEEAEDRMKLLIRILSPYVSVSTTREAASEPTLFKRLFSSRRHSNTVRSSSPMGGQSSQHPTVWDALLSLPRNTLDAYQPLIHLSALFRGRTVPSIDYYTAKLDILTSLITEKRTKGVSEYDPMSTAFVTFADPADARRACKFLAVNPTNPLQCFVTMAPSYEDLDWMRLMKPTFRVEFVKDWLVNLGVWGFTIFWVFPISLLVGLVSIQNISSFVPGLESYLDKHPWEEELLESFLPTVLVSLLTLLIPLSLLLIAKKAHTFATLSALHDRIMTRYYKFLVVNVLIFFCVGTASLQSFLVSFKDTTGLKVIQVVADSFPTAGPFYVGWLIFAMGMHGGLELALFGLPMILYPGTKRQVTPRKRAIGIRPRTFNYYYWLPNHVLAVHVFLVFAVLNPLVIPFAFIYFCVQAVVIKNQLLHVYAKSYEGHGQTILIRLIRYSSDGLLLAQIVFLAYMVVLKKKVNVGVSAVLIISTSLAKLLLTRLCRARFERDDMLEAEILGGKRGPTEALLDEVQPIERSPKLPDFLKAVSTQYEVSRTLPSGMRSWRFPQRIDDGYATIPRRPHHRKNRRPNPFGPGEFDDASDDDLQTKSMVAGISSAIEAVPIGPEKDTADPHQWQAEHKQSSRPLPVTQHPPHPAWDDESSPDQTFDNPYYTQAIPEELWLPRDPLSLLNLDDTVDVRLCLTTQPGSGKLGAWREDEFIRSGLSSFINSMGSIGDHDRASTAFGTAPRRLNGDEQIDLPLDIATRIEKEHDVETAVSIGSQGSMFRRRQTSDGGGIGLGRPNSSEESSGARFFSLDLPGSSRLPFSIFTLSGRYRHRSASADHERGLRDMGHTGSHFNAIPPSGLRVPTFPLDREASAGTGVISLREAVIEEAIVEEEAAQEHLRREEAEEERAERPRYWLTSWMFAEWR